MRKKQYTIYRLLGNEKRTLNHKVEKAEVGRAVSAWMAVYPEWDIRAELVR